jgi:hypothetical protein
VTEKSTSVVDTPYGVANFSFKSVKKELVWAFALVWEGRRDPIVARCIAPGFVTVAQNTIRLCHTVTPIPRDPDRTG